MAASFRAAAAERAVDASRPVDRARVSASGLRYLLTLPSADANEPWPLLLHLHGAASRGMAFREFLPPHSSARCGDAALHGFIVVRPQCPPRKEWTRPALQLQLIGLLDELCDCLPVDTARLYLSGSSMGGDGAYALAAASSSPTRRFAALVPVCAGINLKAAATLAELGTPVWIWHGVEDTVYPVALADAMYEALSNRSSGGEEGPDRHRGEVCYSRLEHCATPATSSHAVGHAAWLDAFAADSSLWQWLRRQQLLDGPPEVHRTALEQQYAEAAAAAADATASVDRDRAMQLLAALVERLKEGVDSIGMRGTVLALAQSEAKGTVEDLTKISELHKAYMLAFEMYGKVEVLIGRLEGQVRYDVMTP